MVDFNNENTVGTPAIDVVKILILQRRNDVIEALEFYKKHEFGGAAGDLAATRARLFSLFLELQASLKRKMSAKEYEALEKKISSATSTEAELIEIIGEINDYLDVLRLIRIDTKELYDSTKTEIENKKKGFS